MHFAVVVLSLSLVAYGAYTVARGSVRELECEAAQCRVVRRTLLGLPSQSPATEWIFSRAASRLTVELRVARGRGTTVHQLSRLVVDGRPLSDFVAGHTRVHQQCVEWYQRARPQFRVSLEGRVRPLLGAGLVVVVGLVALAAAYLLDGLGERMARQQSAEAKPKTE